MHLLDPTDLSLEQIDSLYELAAKIMKNPDEYREICKRKKLAVLFYEPSTRTRLSFESAMINLGGSVIGFTDEKSSSAAKGESIADTIRVVSNFADICAIRHPKEGAPLVASRYSSIPIINAGDGGHQHPTQTLTDMFTIKQLKHDFSNLNIGISGDIKFGRTTHSLIKSLSRYQNIKFSLISPYELKAPDYIIDLLQHKNIEFTEYTKLEEAIQNLDVLYMTRIQKERFFNEEDYIRLKDELILDNSKMSLAPSKMIVLHPLPRVNEISAEVDDDPRAKYFDQVKYGMYIRMALILTMLDLA